MHPTAHLHALVAVLGVSAALMLSGCGGSSKNANQTANRTSSSKSANVTSSQTSSTSSTAATNSAQAAAARAAIVKLTGCLRKYGIKVPPQNLSGPSPTFNSKGLLTGSPPYKHCFPIAVATYKATLRRPSSRKH